MSIDWTPFVNSAIILAASAIALVAVKAKQYADAHIKNSTAREIFDRVSDFMATEVRAIAQAELPAAKEALADGKISKEEAQKLRDIALNRVKKNLGPDGLAALKSALGDRSVEEYLISLLESHVHSIKA